MKCSRSKVPAASRRAAWAGRAVAAALCGAALAPIASAQTTPVRYTEVIRSILYLPSYVAMQKGYFKEQGLDVNMSTAWGTEKAVPQLISGTTDIALLGPEVQVFMENSPSPDKTRIFCKLTNKDGLLVVSRQKMSPGQFKWDAVKGKDWLDWRPATTPQIDAEWVLGKHGLDIKKDLNYITSVGSGNRDAAWMGGKGDFGTFFEPSASRIEREGKGSVVASIGNEIGPVAFTVFITSKKYIDQNPKAVQGWCNAIHKAQVFVHDTPPAELAKLAASYFPQLDQDLLVSSIKRYKDLGIWSTNVTTSPEDMNKVQEVMVHGGVLKPEQRVSYEKAVTPVFSEKANANPQ